MRRIFDLLAIAAASVVVLIGPSFAADKAGPPAAPMIAEPAPKPQFHGLYIAALIGHAAGQLNDAEGFKLPRDGYVAHAAIGYNHRLPGSVVVSLEADLGVTDISGETSSSGFTVRGSSKLNGSIRGRLGIPLGSTLLYGTGGLAMQHSRLAVEGVGSDSINRLPGYVFGGGAELHPFGLLAPNLGLRIEALRYVWRDKAFEIDGEAASVRQHETVIRTGLVFRLN